ncbi:MAG: tetratricopeptide repeat protein [Rhodospirillales bacterium]|nr:tetratricopeptide repeat protein [Rhodospirillales bacterium]
MALCFAMRLRALSAKAIVILSILSFGGMMGFAMAQTAPEAHADKKTGGETISVRAADHGAFTRIVLDGFEKGNVPDVTVRENPEKPGGEIVVVLGSSVPVNLSAAPQNVARVTGIETRVEGEKDVSVLIHAPGHERFRHFRAGNRILVDIYGPDSAVGASAQKPPDSRKPEPEKESKPIKPASVPPPAATPTMPAIAVQSVKKEKLVRPIERHVVALTSTEIAGMAAFVRSGVLWIVFDRTNLPVNGRIDGPQKDMFPPLERLDFDGGTAFRTTLPGPANVYSEGGGLVWRVVLTPGARQTHPVMPRRLAPEKNAQTPPPTGLVWPTHRAERVVDLHDPGVGDKLKVVTVDRAPESSGPARSYVDFNLLRSAAGFVFAPKVDDLSVRVTSEGVEVSRPSGLALETEEDKRQRAEKKSEKHDAPDASQEDGAAPDERKVYNFPEWTMGGDKAMENNRRIMMIGIGTRDEAGQASDLLTLARMYVANGWGPEALGFLRIVLQSTPELETNPSFLALRGAARTLAGEYELAVKDLADPALDSDPDVPLWRSVVWAGLEDWRQAAQTHPKNATSTLVGYPSALRDILAPVLAEIALRDGKPDDAAALLALLGADGEPLRPEQDAAQSYLRGEILRQKGETEKATEIFKTLANGQNDLFRVKAGLAFVNLALETEKIKPSEAIDRLEGMRYGWRGDELEMLVNARLGKAYLANGQYAKGLSVLKDAAALWPDSPLSADIRTDMALAFEDAFMTDRLEKMSPLDAITLYDAFQDLTPEGPAGDDLIRRLAESLVKADLLGRAAALIQNLIDHRLSGPDAAQAAVRLGAIYLLDGRPENALSAIQKASTLRESIVDPTLRTRIDRDLVLLRARALSQMDKPEQALALLGDMPPGPEVNRLRVDIAWGSENWDEAAEALADILLDSGVSSQGTIEPEQARLIINRAVALALADNRLALANMRDMYGKAMEKTDQAKLFDVITRARKAAVLADRQTLMGVVSEVDLFRSFLDSLKNGALEMEKTPEKQVGGGGL